MDVYSLRTMTIMGKYWWKDFWKIMNKYDHNQDPLTKMHIDTKWIEHSHAYSHKMGKRVKERSVYKCLTILHPCVHGTGPGIISNLIKTKPIRRSLRSNNLKHILDIPRTNRVTYGDWAFLAYARKLWNN